jgi:hypothetical protein
MVAAGWWKKLGSVSSCVSGSATHACSACSRDPLARRSGLVRSEWTMPLPAVIQLMAPGWIACTVPRLSRWRISPSNR